MNPFKQPRAVRAIALLLATALAGLPALASAAPAPQAITFAKGSDHASTKGKLKGPADIVREYTVDLAAGQTLLVEVKDKKETTFFNVFPPGAPHREGEGRSKLEVKARVDGTYTIRLFLTNGAAIKGASAAYELTVKKS
ncbi:hypothetical protein [Dokdonella sp.]|uniref:hypothetical protein n=1 Tax=Dokdonella sp. TaxID=2291710 RepID=UPI00378316EF